VQSLYAERRALNAESERLHAEKGRHFRATRSRTEAEISTRAEFDRSLADLEIRKRSLAPRIAALRERRAAIERGPEAIDARAALKRIGDEAELARMMLVRSALLTIEGLTHTNHRPSAWWLPMLDRSGDWFRRIVATTELYTEPLLTAPIS
jgi:hypothetical protein